MARSESAASVLRLIAEGKHHGGEVKPHHLDLDSWSIACDHAKDSGLEDGDPSVSPEFPGFLRYVSPSVSLELKKYIRHKDTELAAGPRWRKVTLFNYKTLVALCKFLGLKASRYVRRAQYLNDGYYPA